jgi:tRNA threonylcarbamoyladenosine biosynthesis protein TsaE
VESVTDTVVTKSAAETQKRAAALAAGFAGGEVVLLTGDLGAGKTTFTQGLAAALGVTRRVLSPTFTVVKEYEGRLKLYHMDMYRLEEEGDADALGLEEYFASDAVTVIEWNRIQNLKGKIMTVEMENLGGDRRKITVGRSAV